jgi:serine/threonine protein kinase
VKNQSSLASKVDVLDRRSRAVTHKIQSLGVSLCVFNPTNSFDDDRRYLPEPFLWHVFKGLMEAAKTMETGPFEYLDKFGKRFDSSYIVHCDIKPENSELLCPGFRPIS